MLSRWLERGLGNIVAPDEKFAKEQPPPEGMSSFWRMVAPDPVYENKISEEEPPPAAPAGTPEAASNATAPPPAAFMSPGFKMDSIQCIHCEKTTPIRSSKPTREAEGYRTPSPDQNIRIEEEEATQELNQKVLSAAKGFSESMFSPQDKSAINNKVFRLCASGKPLLGKLPKTLENSLVKDKTILKARAAKLGQLVPDGLTPLMAAAHAGNVGAAKIILNADKEDGHLDRDLQGRTALHIAAQEGNVEVAEVLKEKHEGDAIPPDALLDLTGRTPFGTLLTSPNPKAKKNRSKMEKMLFSPKDISIFGSPEPVQARETVHRWLDVVTGESEMPGYRVTMEDAICNCNWHDKESGDFYCLLGVCDGHGDQGKVSKFVAKEIVSLMQIKTKLLNKQQEPTDWQQIWTDACLEIDDKIKAQGLLGGSTAVLALITKKDIVVANVGDSRCILVQRDTNAASSEPAENPSLVDENEAAPTSAEATNGEEAATDENETAPTENVGDKPAEATNGEEAATAATQDAGAETEEGDKAAPLGNETAGSGFEVVALSEDHKPNLSHERERVEKAGMTVVEETFTDNGQEVTIHKVQKNSSNLMAVSRSFGDFEYKANNELGKEEQAIIAVPEVRVHSRSAEKDMYLIAACDGVWDVMTNDDVAKFIVGGAESTKEEKRGRLPQIGDTLLKECLARGSRDNVTVAMGALSTSMEKFAVGAIKGRALDFSSTEPVKEEPSQGQHDDSNASGKDHC